MLLHGDGVDKEVWCGLRQDATETAILHHDVPHYRGGTRYGVALLLP